MATTIKLKNGSGAPLAGDLVQGEPALDLTNKRLYTEDSGGTVIEVGTNPSTLTVDTDTLVVDAANNRVGIGTASPARILHVENNGLADLLLRDTSSYSAGTGPAVIFQGKDSGGTTTQFGAIYGVSNGSNSGELKFETRNSGSTAERMRIDASGNVGIGNTSPSTFTAAQSNNLVVGAGSGAEGITIYSGTSNQGSLAFADGTAPAEQYRGLIQYSHANNSLAFWTETSERMRINSSGNLLVGTTDGAFVNGGGIKIANATAARLKLCDSNSAGTGSADGFELTQSGTAAYIYQNENDFMAFGTNATEAMRIDSNGTLLVGKTSTGIGTAGIELTYDNVILGTRNGGTAQYLNRLTSDGNIIEFQKASTTVGSIGSEGGDSLYIGSSDTGLHFSPADFIRPWNPSTNSIRDAAIDLGSSSGRFKDLYLSGGAYIGGTGAANHLDDYEEGTFSPTISTGTASFSNATYTKVGRVVVVTVFFQSVSDQSSATALQVGNLPFTSDSNTFSAQTGLSRHFNRGDGTIVAYMGGSSNVLNFYALDLGADYLAVRHSDLNNAGANYYATITYIAA